MKKGIAFLCFLVLLFGLSVLKGAAAEEDVLENYKASVEEALEEQLDAETRALLNEIGLEDLSAGEGVEISFEKLLSFFKEDARTALQEILRPFTLSLLLVLVLAFVSSLAGQAQSEALETAALCVVVLQNAALIRPLLSAGATLLHTSALFVKGFLPVYAGLVAFSGAPASALGVQSLVFALCEALSALSETLCVHVPGAFLGFAVACAFSSHVRMPKLLSCASRAMNWVLGFLCAVFTGVLGTKSVLSAAADSAAGKSVRFLLSSSIPVVGAAMSDAYSSIVASIHLIRGSAAVAGVVALLVLHVPVLLQSLAADFAFKVLAAAGDVLGLSKTSGLFQCFALTLRFVLLLGVLELFLFLIAIGLLLQVKGGG